MYISFSYSLVIIMYILLHFLLLYDIIRKLTFILQKWLWWLFKATWDNDIIFIMLLIMRCNQKPTTTCSLDRVDTWYSRRTNCMSLRRPVFSIYIWPYSLSSLLIWPSIYLHSTLCAWIPSSLNLLISELKLWPAIHKHTHRRTK